MTLYDVGFSLIQCKGETTSRLLYIYIIFPYKTIQSYDSKSTVIADVDYLLTANLAV